jgi:hypothetical protein
MTFQIPKSERARMSALVSASPQVLDAFASALDVCVPQLDQSKFALRIADKVSGIVGVSKESIEPIALTLFALHTVLQSTDETVTPAAFSGDVVVALKSDHEFTEPTEGWAQFESRLTSLLESKPLSLAAKASVVAFENPRHTQYIRILTDARPVFGSSASDGPKAFAVLHTLQIGYFEDNDLRPREWFVSVDADDLEALRNAVNRAIDKETSLRVALKPIGVPVMSWRERTNG